MEKETLKEIIKNNKILAYLEKKMEEEDEMMGQADDGDEDLDYEDLPDFEGGDD